MTDYQKLKDFISSPEARNLIRNHLDDIENFLVDMEPQIVSILTALGRIVVDTEANCINHLMKTYGITQDDATEIVLANIRRFSK